LEAPVFVPECGHWLPQERLDVVSAAIVDFARRHQAV
jgi:pimeloyl-ACP methyl ester carboxylesterase